MDRGRWTWAEGVLTLVDDVEYECFIVRAEDVAEDDEAEPPEGWVWIAVWGDGEGSGTMNGPAAPSVEEAREAAMAWMTAHPLGGAMSDEDKTARRKTAAYWTEELDGTFPDGTDMIHYEGDTQDGILFVGPVLDSAGNHSGEWGFEADYSFEDEDGDNEVEAIYEDPASWVDPEQAKAAAERWAHGGAADAWLRQFTGTKKAVAGFLDEPTISQR